MNIIKKYKNVTLLILVSMLVASDSECDNLSIDALLLTEIFNPEGDVIRNQEMNIEINIGTEGWRIVRSDNNGVWDFGCNGIDIFSLYTFNDKNLTPAGYVEPGIIPNGRYPITVPWIVYCATIFDHSTKYLPPPWSNPGKEPGAHKYRIESSKNDRFPNFYNDIQWIGDPEIAKIAHRSSFIRRFGMNPTEKELFDRWKFDLPNNFLQGFYKSSGLHQIGKWSLPTKGVFEHRRYIGEAKDKSNWKLSARYTITTLKLKELPDDYIFLPAIKSSANVVDLRLSKSEEPPAIYLIKDNWIEDENNVLVVESFESARDKLGVKKRNKSFAANAIQAMLVATFLLPVYFVVKKTTIVSIVKNRITKL